MVSGRLGLSARITVTILAILAVSILTCFAIVYQNVAKVTGDAALREVDQSTRAVAISIQSGLERDLQIARDLADHAAALLAAGVTDRAAHGAIAKGTLAANPALLASWYAWEPNALDGKDAEFAGRPGHDATGRYVPYYNRGSGEISLEPLLNYTVPGAGDYYLIPMARGSETLVEPYIYPVNGQPTLMTSIVVPILIDGKPRGVGGVDVALAPLLADLGQIRPLETGVIGLLSANGAWVAHPDAGLVTKPVATQDPTLEALLKSVDDKGEAHVTGTSSLLGEESFLSLRRIEIGKTGDELYLVTAIPTRTVWHWANNSLMLLVASAAVLMAVASTGCWLVLRAWLRRPLGALIASVDQITAGALDQTIPFGTRSDEMGAMSRALDVFRQNAVQLRAAERAGEEEAREQREVVKALAEGLNRLAEGDLTAAIPGAFDPRYEKLRQDFNATVASLRGSMAALEAAGEEIGTEAGAIEHAVSDLSRRTEDQASTLQETSAAFGRITESVRDTARSADEANGIAAETRADAHRSGIVVTEAVSSMDAILDSSRRISQIIGVIDDIAFQTNLLALNAGVEAARAGEAGRGFAVVASEVRALAQRAAEAARQVKELINESADHVAKGVERVGAAGQSLSAIVGKVEQVASLISGIASGAKEQYANLAEVTSSVARMDTVTQQNAAMAEETTAAAGSLVENGRELRDLIRKFETGSGPMAVAAGRRSRAA
jgi:methyl-accepting chemotaxis protein/methyl-accepting chemotaxis protein-1 (serine sensor receptor)